MFTEEAIMELELCKSIIKQSGKDWLDERDIPVIDAAIEALKALESTRWIPVSERLPEKDGDYLVTLDFEWGREIEMGWLIDGEWLNPNGHAVVAWMPRPEPWEGESK